MEKFGSWLLEELDQRNMSQADLVRECKITPSQISQIISGKRNAGIKSLINIAQTFKLPLDYVFEKAGLLPSNSDLSRTQRTLINFAKGLPDSDLELAIVLLEKLESRKDKKI
jgi:transcriptional regulator with XRE-family HTH domain